MRLLFFPNLLTTLSSDFLKKKCRCIRKCKRMSQIIHFHMFTSYTVRVWFEVTELFSLIDAYIKQTSIGTMGKPLEGLVNYFEKLLSQPKSQLVKATQLLGLIVMYSEYYREQSVYLGCQIAFGVICRQNCVKMLQCVQSGFQGCVKERLLGELIQCSQNKICI